MQREKRVLLKYYRLSLEDEKNGESNSISNQRKLVEDYIVQDANLSKMESLELVDDGYTGTNFKRPGMQKLLALLHKNKVACIIVKDFSRFSRDYIEMGNYLEQIFPFMEIRFIAINDQYDSLSKTVSNGLEVSFKGILNDLYSKDISMKSKAAKRQMIKQGKLCGGSHPFGYRKDPTGASVYCVDRKAAEIVQLIFEQALLGKTTIEIARWLNQRKLPTPGMYKRLMGDFGYGIKEGESAIWDSPKVLRILRDERYKGTLVLGKHQSAGVGTGKIIERPREMWYRKEHAIAAIISEETFAAVQAAHPYQKKGSYHIKRHILYRKVRCGCCGKYLYFKPSGSGAQYNSFFCKKSHLDTKSKCFTGYIKEKKFLDTLVRMMQKQIEVFGEMDENWKKERESQEQQIFSLKKNLKVLKARKMEDYQHYRDGAITRAEFLKAKKESQNTCGQLEDEIAHQKEIHQPTYKSGNIETWDWKWLDYFLEGVYVYDIDRMELKLKFHDNIHAFP